MNTIKKVVKTVIAIIKLTYQVIAIIKFILWLFGL